MEMTRLAFPLVTKEPLRCLQLGLGIGVSANALKSHGEIVDIIELDPLIYKFAVDWFDLKVSSQAQVFLEDALKVVPNLPAESYDIIMHDIFTGGLMESSLFTLNFMSQLRRILKPDGIIGMVKISHIYRYVYMYIFLHLFLNRMLSVPLEILYSLQSTKHCIRFFLSSDALGMSLSMRLSATLQVYNYFTLYLSINPYLSRCSLVLPRPYHSETLKMLIFSQVSAEGRFLKGFLGWKFQSQDLINWIRTVALSKIPWKIGHFCFRIN